MVRVINNNLWTPVPWGFGCGGHQCNGGNNWMQKMFGYQMLFNMMQNIGRCYATPPQQQGGFYPGLYLGGGGGGAAMPQNYEEYLQQQQDAQSLTELKSAYSEFNIRKIGDRYFAYLKSDKTQRIEADSIDELMDGLNEYVDQNPDKFKAKPATRTEHEGEGDIEHHEVADDKSVTPAGDAPGNTQTQRGNKFRLPQAPQGYEWKNYTNLSDRSGYTKDMTLDAVLDKLGLEKNDANRQLLRDANPNGIKNDKVADVNKLTLLVKKSNSSANVTGDVPEHWTRGNIQTSDKWKVVRDKSKVNSHSGAKSSAEFIARLYSGTQHLKLDALTQLIIDKNPDIFDGNGGLKSGADLDKLIIPRSTSDHLTALGVIKTGKELAHLCELCPGSRCKYRFYDANGNQMDELAYATKYPDKYIASVKNLKGKFWTPETLKKAMELYNTYYPQSRGTFKKFEIKYKEDTGAPYLWCDYKYYRRCYANYSINFNKDKYKIGELETIYTEANNP